MARSLFIKGGSAKGIRPNIFCCRRNAQLKHHGIAGVVKILVLAVADEWMERVLMTTLTVLADIGAPYKNVRWTDLHILTV